MSEVGESGFPPEYVSSDQLSRRQLVLRRGRLAAVLALVLAGGLVLPFPLHGRLWAEIFDLAHAPAFFATLLCLVGFFDPAAAGVPSAQTLVPMTFHRAVLVALGLTFVGLTGEFLQKFANRTPSWGDVAANSAGLLAALFWIAAFTQQRGRRVLLLVAAVSMLSLISLDPILQIEDCVQQIRSFPLLASFERNRELGGWWPEEAEIERSREWASDGQYSLKIMTRPAWFTGASMECLNRDWTTCRRLLLDIFNPQKETLTLTIKLYDQKHKADGFESNDRFEHSVVVPPDSRITVSIPFADVTAAPEYRDMQLNNMAGIELFSVNTRQPHVYFVDHVRLEP
ncbi:MAG: hypothetical protein RIK87_21670 [Fuerstiella sp.]